MGLFGSSKKTQVGSQAQRVVDDNMLPETVKTSVMRAIMAKGENVSIPEYLINGFANTVALKADRLMHYAQNEYSYGLPKTDIVSRDEGQDVVQGIIELEVGHPIVIENFEFAPINSLHVGWMRLVEDYGYDTVTNKLTTLSAAKGFPVYLEDLVAVYTVEAFNERDTNALGQWGLVASGGYTDERRAGQTLGKYAARTNFIVDEVATENTVEVHTQYTNSSGNIVRELIVLPMTGFDDDVEYYHVRYTYTDSSGTEPVERTGFWLYENGAGLYPTIDEIHALPFDDLGTYFPFIYFRRNKTNMAAAEFEGTPDYETSVQLLNHLDMNFVAVADEINENPDIADIQQAMMVVAISAHDTSDVGKQYLFDHFDALYALGTGTIDWPDQETIEHRFSQVIRDREFQFTFRHSGLSKRRRTGVIAEVGEYQSDLVETTSEEEVKKRGISGTIETLTELNTGEQLILRHQVSDSMYDEISVFKPELVYHIFGYKKYVAGFGADSLLIPIDYSLLDGYSLGDREVLISRSMHFLFNSRVTIKTKWYQSGLFKGIMLVVAVAVAIYTGIDIYSALVTAFEAGAWAVVQLIITQIVIGIVVQETFQLIVSVIGGEFALILATVAAVVALAYRPGSITSVKGAPWAEELLYGASNMIRAVQVETQEDFEKLQDDMRDFEEDVETKTELLKEAQDLLEVDSLINPMEFVGLVPFSLPGEEPQDLYNRTVHSGNVGIKALNAISEYVDATLTLPTVDTSLRSTFNEF